MRCFLPACLVAIIWSTLATAKCKTFTLVSSNASFVTGGPKIPASKGVTCPASETRDCGLGAGSRRLDNVSIVLDPTSGSIVEAYSTTDLTKTFSSTVVNSLLDLIGKTVNDTFYNPLEYNVTAGFSISPGQSGWITWQPTLQCYTGTLSDCSGDDYPASGVRLTACTPSAVTQYGCKTLGVNQYRCAKGDISFQNSTADEAKNLNCSACTRTANKDNTVVLGSGASGEHSSWALLMAAVVAALMLQA